MKIVITGGAGFIGSNAAEYFLARGHEVLVIDNLSRKGSSENLHRLKDLKSGPALRFESIDIRDAEALRGTFKIHDDVEAVIHLAGQVAVTTSVTNPREDFEVNAQGTFNILEALREANLKPIVLFSSTNKVYGGLHGVSVEEGPKRYSLKDLPSGISEETALDFHSPYGCSKGSADQYVRDYSRIYGLPTVVFRQSCVYGQNQLGIEDQGWVAWFTIAALFDHPLTVYGNGKQVRDVLHIDDLLALYETAIEKRKEISGEIFNVGGGPDFTLSLLELLEHLESTFGRKLSTRFADWRPGDQPIYVSDIRRIEKTLGWKPRIGPKEGIDKLAAWVKANETLIRRTLFANTPAAAKA
jgi:CDP-paratose 2-epimerase